MVLARVSETSVVLLVFDSEMLPSLRQSLPIIQYTFHCPVLNHILPVLLGVEAHRNMELPIKEELEYS